ncbi:hypothetical protein M2H09_03875 [Vibrio vulnificus]|nr:hypothetical protein [Vibrio vulnificus]
MRTFKEVWEEHDTEIVGVFFVVLFFLSVVGSYLALKEDERRWAEFKTKHNCVLVEKGRSKVATTTGVSPDGKIVVGSTLIKGDDKYRCDDGVVYIR